jgi:hypothetical protein
MKTLKFFIVLCFIAAFVGNNVYAQNRVLKEVWSFTLGPWYCPCTGDYLYGDITMDVFTSSHNQLYKIRDNTMYGYKDAAGTELSGNVYEYSQTSPVLNWYENTAIFRLNKKIVAEAHFAYHITTNANGDIIVERSQEIWNCK